MRKFRTSVEGGDGLIGPGPNWRPVGSGPRWGGASIVTFSIKTLSLPEKSDNTPASSARSSVFLIHRSAFWAGWVSPALSQKTHR